MGSFFFIVVPTPVGFGPGRAAVHTSYFGLFAWLDRENTQVFTRGGRLNLPHSPMNLRVRRPVLGVALIFLWVTPSALSSFAAPDSEPSNAGFDIPFEISVPMPNSLVADSVTPSGQCA